MSAKIIAFPSAKPPPVKTPEIARDTIAAEIAMAVDWYQQGKKLEDLPADMDPELRRTMGIMLSVIERGQRS